MQINQSHRFAVAPMMDWTDRHCRVFHRLMTRRGRLYTEMLTSGAIIHGDRQRLLGFDSAEHPVALQLGGFDPRAQAVVAAGADALIVHARKAWLNGLSPKENRDIPPLDYDRVYRLKASMPDVPIIINGGIASLAEARQHLVHVDGVMLGRAAYQEPWRLLAADPELFGVAAPYATMKDVFEAVMPYIEDELAQGTRLHSITRHFVGAFHGVPGARAFRRHLAENGVRPGAGADVLRDAVALVEDRTEASIAA